MPTETIDAQTPVISRDGLHERRVGDKVFVLDNESTMHVLDNDVAVAIWDAIRDAPEGGISGEAIARSLVDDFDVALPEASADVLDFVHLLHARGVIHEASVVSD
jgi:hypothetical protein